MTNPSAARILGPAEFDARIPIEYQTAGLEARFEQDYALTRLVAANCAAVDENATTPTALVVKGGFAIRHIYAGPRFSKDADLSMISDDVEMDGPDGLILPYGMRESQRELGQGLVSWIVTIGFRNTRGREKFITCDLNTRERPIRRHPVLRATVSSYFMDPFEAWAATVEEIIGEKLFAIADQGVIRVKDIFDIVHMLDSVPLLPLDPAGTREIYDELRTNHRRARPPFEGLPRVVSDVVADPAAAAEWQRAVGNLLPSSPDLETSAARLVHLIEGRLLA